MIEKFDRSEFVNEKSHINDIMAQSMLATISKLVHTSLIGVVDKFYPETQTCDVTPIQPVKKITEDGSNVIYEDVTYPLLQDVPVQFPAGGGFTLTFPVKRGDECLLIFNQRSIAEWAKSNDGGVQESGSRMTYSMDDAIAIVGINASRTVGSTLPSINEDEPELRTNDGSVKLRITTGGIEVDGNLDVGGDITATGNIEAQGDVVAGTVSLKNHSHAQPPLGTGTYVGQIPVTGDSGPPTP